MDIKTPEFVSLQFQIAGLGSRASAFIIDQLILIIVNLIFFFTFFLVDSGLNNAFFVFDSSPVLFAIFIIVLFLIRWGYFFAMEYFYGGRTLGKKMMGIRVIQENGHSLTLLSSFIRNLLRIVDQLPSAYLIGMILIFFHNKHKRLGDLVAGTIVIHERKANKKNKRSKVDKEIEERGISEDDLDIDDWTLRSLKEKEWNLIKTYTNRYMYLSPAEKVELTKQVASILFSKIGIETNNKTTRELENTLFVLYLKLKQEWEYEL